MLGHVSGYVISSEEQESGDLYKTIIEQSSDEPTLTIFTKELARIRIKVASSH